MHKSKVFFKCIVPELKKLCIYERIKFNVKLDKYTTLKIGGICDTLFEPSTKIELVNVLNLCHKYKYPFWILGAGSNVLIDSNGIKGLVIVTTKLSQYYIVNNKVIVECGARLSKISRVFCDLLLTGMEFAIGIPGSIGGAVVSNAGAFDGDMSKIVEKVICWCNGSVLEINNKDILFNYRKSIFKNNKKYVIIEIQLMGKKIDINSINNKMKQFSIYRAKTQAVGYPSAGSIFNCLDIPPAYMIDCCGLKGERIGGAMVSTIHSGFIVNYSNATSKDVIKLIKKIKKVIYKNWNKKLILEIVYWRRNDV